MKHQLSISVVIPCFNESEVIYSNLCIVSEYLNSHFKTFEIIAIDDGSTDSTFQELRRAQADLGNSLKIIRQANNQGKGQAIKDGALKSRYEIIMFLDADLTIPIQELEKFIPKLREHDIVIASRALPETIFEEKVPWYRFILAKSFRFIQTALVNNADISDSQCGFKVFKRDVALNIFPLLTVRRFAFDVETLFLANRFGYSIGQLPVTILRDSRKSHIRIISDPINMFFDLLKIRLNVFFGRYPKPKSTGGIVAKAEDTSA